MGEPSFSGFLWNSGRLAKDYEVQSVKIRFSIEETDDFRTWTKRDGINEVTVPLEAGRKFYRFALEDE